MKLLKVPITLTFIYLQESESLAALRDLTNRSATVAGGMVTILDSFEHRLAKLETTILPVYQQTGNLQRRHQSMCYSNS